MTGPVHVSRPCEACGLPISPRRLAAVPETPWCVQCAESRVARVGGVMHVVGDEERELEIVPTLDEARARLSHSPWALGTNGTSEGQR